MAVTKLYSRHLSCATLLSITIMLCTVVTTTTITDLSKSAAVPFGRGLDRLHRISIIDDFIQSFNSITPLKSHVLRFILITCPNLFCCVH